jgi:hypothetical protein
MEDLKERDLFAMMAMCGLLANRTRDPNSVAIEAYQHADAMMIARQPKGENYGS